MATANLRRGAETKLTHMAGHVAPDGRVSARCYSTPRAIDLRRATWTIRPEAVTCPKCRAVLDGGFPSIFSGPMVCALLADLKTQTRRLASSPLAKVKAGDRLWVRENWCPANSDGGPVVCYQANLGRWYPENDGPDEGAGPSFDYSKFPAGKGAWSIWASDLESGTEKGWRPSIHMPRWASRITLLVEEVRTQKLQDISEADAIAEGADRYTSQTKVHRAWNPDWKGLYRPGFMELWDSLHGAKPGEGWDDNPTVVALTFRVIKANIDGGSRGC